jgi:hypothetical protein
LGRDQPDDDRHSELAVSEQPVGERIARLEKSIEHIESQLGELDDIDKKLSALHRRMDKQYSFLGGIAFVISGLWAIADFAIKLVFHGKS